MLLTAKEISGSGTVAEGLFVALPAGNEGKVAFPGILKSLEPGSWLFTGFISSLYSLYIHLTVAISMEYCQYTKCCLFSIVYKLVLLYVKGILGKLPNRISPRRHGDTEKTKINVHTITAEITEKKADE